jgi:hypothetical protein
MKRFFTKIGYFILPIIVIAYPLDYGLSHFLKQTKEIPAEFEVWNDIYSSNANCDIAIYGSSRAWVHIDPKVISDSLSLHTYNFGIDGHNFWMQYLRHLELVKYNKTPKTIVLSVDIFSLQKREDLFNPDQFLPYMLWNTNIREYTGSFIGYNKFDYYIPLVRYSGKISVLKTFVKNSIKGSSAPKIRNNGFLGMDKPWNSDLEKAKTNSSAYEIKIDSNTVNLLEKFIKECESKGIELVLVYTPEFIEGQKFVSNRDAVMRIYKNFATRYALNFYDYSSDSICLNKTLFYNANHLNKKGADIFSKKFAHDLKTRLHKNPLVKEELMVNK